MRRKKKTKSDYRWKKWLSSDRAKLHASAQFEALDRNNDFVV